MRKERKKIVLVYDCIYPFVKGGGERRFYEIGTRMAKMGHEVHWYGMKFWDGKSVYELDGIFLHGLCKARPIYTKSGRRSVKQAILFGLSTFKLVGVKFDVIDCCGFPYFSLFPAKIISVLRRKPLHSTWHEVWGKEYWLNYLGLIGIVGYWIEKISSSLPDKVITTSIHTTDLFKKNFRNEKVIIVSNGIDYDFIHKVKPSRIKSDIIFAGRLLSYKNVDLIIKSMGLLKSNNVKVSFSIIGEGPEKANLVKLAKKIGVYSQIKWFGQLDKNEDVYSLLKSSKVFVLPSEREGFSIVSLESNACGTPVITANFSSNASKELIRNGVNGYVFEPTALELANLLKKVFKKNNINKTASIYAKKYDWDVISAKLSETYSL